MKLLSQLNISNRRVVIRADLNVPIHNGQITNDERIRAAIPCIQHCLAENAEVVLISHLGRPKGKRDPQYSLKPLVSRLEHLLNRPVQFVEDWRSDSFIKTTQDTRTPGNVSLCENLRFEPEEELNDPNFGKQLASIGDVYVMEAFGTAHRAHASTYHAIKLAEISCAGPLLTKEIDTLTKVLNEPNRPLVTVIGGKKVAGKLEILQRLSRLSDRTLIGGGMANTFLQSQGIDIGSSRVENELSEIAGSIVSSSNAELPVDAICCKQIDPSEAGIHRLLDEIQPEDLIVDIGPETARRYAEEINNAGTVIWNGPMGVFEIDQFGEGTREVLHAINSTEAFTLAGGGDSIAAIQKYTENPNVDYISTGGGAFLEFAQGLELPALEALRVN